MIKQKRDSERMEQCHSIIARMKNLAQWMNDIKKRFRIRQTEQTNTLIGSKKVKEYCPNLQEPKRNSSLRE